MAIVCQIISNFALKYRAYEVFRIRRYYLATTHAQILVGMQQWKQKSNDTLSLQLEIVSGNVRPHQLFWGHITQSYWQGNEGSFWQLHIFPNKPRSTRANRIDNSRIFLELDYINNIRNRIAHHEPICFGYPICIDTTYTLNNYTRMMTLFQWMGIDANDFLYGIDHVGRECGKIMCI